MDPNDLHIIIRATDRASAVFDDIGGSLGKLEGVAGRVGIAIGVAFAAVSTAVVAGLGASVVAAANFQQKMSGVSAVAGATAAEMAQLSKLALQLGRDTVFSATDAASALEELVKGGVSVGDIMGGAATATLNLAAAGGTTMREAAIIAANALAQFSLKGKDMERVVNLIAGAANASTIDVNQFGLAMQMSGAVAATIGFKFDDLATSIAIMGKAGVVGSDAGTSLKTMMLQLNPTTDKAKDLMKELGIITAAGANQFFDAAGKVRTMTEVAGVLQAATKNLTAEQSIASLKIMFGTDAIRASAIMAKAGTAGFNEMAASMGKVTAASVGAERMNNLKGNIEQLKGSLETAAISIGSLFLPALQKITQTATAFVNAVVPYVMGLTSIGTISGVLGTVTAAIVGFVETAVAWLTAAVPRIGAALALWGAAFWGWIVVAAPPALAALGTFLVSVGAWIVAQVPIVWGFLVGWIGAFAGWAIATIPVLLATLGQMGVALWGWITARTTIIAAQLLAWGTAFWSWVTVAVPPLLVALAGFAVRLWGWIAEQAPVLLAKLVSWGAAMWGWVATAVPPLLVALGGLAVRLWAWIQETAPVLLAQLLVWGAALWGWVTTSVPPLLARLGEFATSLWGWIAATAPLIWARLVAWGAALAGWIVEAWPDFVAKAGVFLSNLWGWISTNGGMIAGKLGEWITVLAGKLGEAVQYLINTVPPMVDRWLTALETGGGGGGANGGMLGAIGHVALKLLELLGRLAIVIGTHLINVWIPAFIRWIPGAIVALVGAIDQMFSGGGAVAGAAEAGGRDWGAVIIGGLVALLALAPGLIVPAITGLVGALGSVLVGALPAVFGAAGSAALAIVAAIGWPITLAIGAAILLVTAWVNDWFGIRTKLTAALTAFGTAWWQGVLLIFQGIGNLGTTIMDLGKAIVSGIIYGITQAPVSIATALGGAVKSAITSAKRALGIASPSLVFAAQVGLPIAQGVAQGIASGQRGVTGALTNLVSPRSMSVSASGTAGASAGTTININAPITGVDHLSQTIVNAVQAAVDRGILSTTVLPVGARAG